MFGLSLIELITIALVSVLIFRNFLRPPGPPWPKPSYNPTLIEAEDELRRRHCANNPRLDSDRPPGTMMDSKFAEISDVQST
jgi:hypothetical protein